MKVYDLRCVHGHGFEAWFGSAAAYESQRATGLVVCPLCQSTEVERAPSVPRLNLAASGANSAEVPSDPGAAMQAALMRMARHVMANTEDVGERFAAEARDMHYERTAQRAIRGVATGEEARELADEGIKVLPLPFAKLVEDPLQ
jgi:hypothetical protein